MKQASGYAQYTRMWVLTEAANFFGLIAGPNLQCPRL
jgi:hypothetical protein